MRSANRGLVHYWSENWPAWSHRPALASPEGPFVTYGELSERSLLIARQLLSLGGRPGDRILIGGSITVETATLIVGALRAGLVVVPTHTAYREREIIHLVTDAGPTIALLEDEEQRGWAANADPGLTVASSVTGSDEVRVSDCDHIDQARGDSPALIAYTSGTTGAPKGAVLSHSNLLASVLAVGRSWGWTDSDVLFLCLPLFHLHGLGVGLLGTLSSGACARLHPAFDVDALSNAAQAGHATMFFGVPTMYERIAASDGAKGLGALRLCVSGSAPLPSDLFDRLEGMIGSPILERYGMTETLMNVSNPLEGERRAGSVGLALPGVDYRLDGDGDEGEILLKGPNVSASYWRNDDATQESRSDGWFKSGDIGRRDPDGYLRIVGRMKELIITGGYNVYPREVEDVLRMHPAITDIAVVGAPSKQWGEEVTAFITVSEAVANDELKDFAASQLVYYKVPKRFIVIDALPRNALGKVVKPDLISTLK